MTIQRVLAVCSLLDQYSLSPHDEVRFEYEECWFEGPGPSSMETQDVVALQDLGCDWDRDEQMWRLR